MKMSWNGPPKKSPKIFKFVNYLYLKHYPIISQKNTTLKLKLFLMTIYKRRLLLSEPPKNFF